MWKMWLFFQSFHRGIDTDILLWQDQDTLHSELYALFNLEVFIEKDSKGVSSWKDDPILKECRKKARGHGLSVHSFRG